MKIKCTPDIIYFKTKKTWKTLEVVWRFQRLYHSNEPSKKPALFYKHETHSGKCLQSISNSHREMSAW